MTAQALAEQGAVVIAAGRSRERCRETVAKIKEQTGNQDVHCLLADLSSQEQIRRLAEQVHEGWPRLDVLINNAGGFFLKRRESVDGIEMTFALNHLNYFLLTHLLLDLLEAGERARIINVSSDAHRGARINFSDIEYRRGFAGMRAYGQSKLANILFTYELARRLEGSSITANALHPGFVATGFGMKNGPVADLVMRVAHLFAISPEEGARTSIYLASSPEVEGVSGEYFVRCKTVRSDPASYDREAAQRLWGISAEMTGQQEGI